MHFNKEQWSGHRTWVFKAHLSNWFINICLIRLNGKPNKRWSRINVGENKWWARINVCQNKWWAKSMIFTSANVHPRENTAWLWGESCEGSRLQISKSKSLTKREEKSHLETFVMKNPSIAQPARMVLGLRSRKFSVPGLRANPYSTISGWEMGTCSRPLNPDDWKLVQNSSLTRVLRVT